MTLAVSDDQMVVQRMKERSVELILEGVDPTFFFHLVSGLVPAPDDQLVSGSLEDGDDQKFGTVARLGRNGN